MNGYQITFFAPQGRKHQGQSLCEWLMQVAKQSGLRGATLVSATEGFGKSGRIHSAHFFELADQPQEVMMAATEEQAERLFEKIRDAGEKVFYVKTRVEFGVLGGEDA